MAPINWTNITNLGQLPAAANTASDGTFWVGILYMCWIVLILLIIQFGWETAMLTASFLGLILGLILVYADLIAWTWILPFVGVMLFMFLYITYVNQQNR